MRPAVLAVLAVLALSAAYYGDGPRTITLREAARLGLVSVRALGGHLGDVVELRVRNPFDYPIVVEVEMGDILVSRDKSKQNLVVVKPVTVPVEPGGSASARLYVACINESLASPGEGDEYEVHPLNAREMGEWGLRLYGVLEDINSRGVHASAAQMMIWAVTGPGRAGPNATTVPLNDSYVVVIESLPLIIEDTEPLIAGNFTPIIPVPGGGVQPNRPSGP